MDDAVKNRDTEELTRLIEDAADTIAADDEANPAVRALAGTVADTAAKMRAIQNGRRDP